MAKKKHWLVLTAALTVTGVMTTVYAASQFTAADVKQLQDGLLGREAVLTTDYDLNSDAKLNGFDLAIMKKMVSTPVDTGQLTESTVPATETYVKLMGRTHTADDVTWLVQSGSAAEFQVTGTTASVSLAGDSGTGNDADHRPRYVVYVDGELLVDKTIDAETEEVTLFEGTTSRTAEVKVILVSEAMYGGVGVKSITTTSSSSIPVKPLPKKELCIEFIGDSITCAYGVEGTSNSDPFKTTTENFTKSYAYLAAQHLGADYSAVCYSGHGIISGYSSGDKNTESLVPDCYHLISKHWEHTGDWDFSKRQNDVVVVNLGTNDINYVTAEFETRSVEFTEGYAAFLQMLREYNPDAYIICTLGTMGGEDLYPLIEEAVATHRTTQNDDRIMCFASAVQNGAADGYGSDWHPSAVTQQNSAYVMADKICQALGMESDKIGLNLAADSEYTTDYNAESGANVYGYVNDYDKSFWINVSMGGSVPEDITAIIPDLELDAGCTYRLEFDYTTSAGEIPLILHGAAEHYTDTITEASAKTHYSAEFVVESDDMASLDFLLGGTDSYNLTLYNIKLVKIKK